MSINKILFDEIIDYFYKYDLDYSDLNKFIFSSATFLERQQLAITIIEDIMAVHGKKNLQKNIAKLAKIEHEIKELEPWVRDHVVHALLSYILGIYINEKYLVTCKVNDFQWKLASLFHDIGYPAQIAKDLLKIFADPINDIKKELGLSVPDIYFQTIPIGLEKLCNNKNTLKLFQKCFDKWAIEINAQSEFNKMIESGEICHGIISALSLVYVIDLLYQKYNPSRKYKDIRAVEDNTSWNQNYFEKDVIQAGAAIFLHNLPMECFLKSKIDRKKAPLAFLLKLSDCLQEWERPSLDNINGFPSSKFDIKIEKERLILKADISIDRKQKIQNEINSILIADDITFC